MNVTPKMIFDLSTKIEGLIELETAQRLPFICIIHDGDYGLGLFTNRSDEQEVIDMLEATLSAVKSHSQSAGHIQPQ